MSRRNFSNYNTILQYKRVGMKMSVGEKIIFFLLADKIDTVNLNTLNTILQYKCVGMKMSVCGKIIFSY